MLKRNARLRREYLYRKSLEGKERELYEKKRKIREALRGEQYIRLGSRVSSSPLQKGSPPGADGKPIPTELRREEQELRKQIELEDDNTAVARNHMDDEYASAGVKDPKVGDCPVWCREEGRGTTDTQE